MLRKLYHVDSHPDEDTWMIHFIGTDAWFFGIKGFRTYHTYPSEDK